MSETKIKKRYKNIKNEFKKRIKEFSGAWSQAKTGTYSASVAYYAVFSIAPLLVIATTFTGIFLNKLSAQNMIISEFRSTFGQSGAEFIKTLIETKPSTHTSIVISIISFIILLIGATGIFTEIQTALDAIFGSLQAKPIESFWVKFLNKILSIGIVLSVGFLLFISLALSAFINLFSHYLSTMTSSAETLAHSIEYSISFLLVSFFLALTYKILPLKKLKWKPALVGGAITGLLFMISKYFLGLYFGSSDAFTGYGAASSLVLLIIWAYYMSQVYFFGAIILRLYVIPEHRKTKT